jgi:alpha-mannosidase
LTGAYPNLKKVVVVFKTHFDLGFTDLPRGVMELYTGPMFAAVRETMKATEGEPESARYTWTLPSWPLKQLLDDPSLPEETRREAERLVREGRLVWHAWPFTTHTAFCGLEELVRGLHISRDLGERFGRMPLAAKQTDVPGHTWILPSLLVRAGVRFLHLGCNAGSHPPHLPPLFWWEGPDGSRLLTYYSVGGYGTGSLPPEDWPHPVWLALQHTVDNYGPHSPADLEAIREEISRGAPHAEVLFGQLGDFAAALLSDPDFGRDLPVVPYDLADTWIHGVGTMPREVARVRALREKLLKLECIAAAHGSPKMGEDGRDFSLARDIAPLIDAAYEQLLLFGEHTWGLDVKSTIKRAFGSDFEKARQTEPYKRLESSWAAKAAYVDRAEELYAQAEAVVRGDRGSEVGGREPAEADEEPAGLSRHPGLPDNVLENDILRVEVDPQSGGIVSLYDKVRGREWVDARRGEPFGGYRYDLYSASDIAEFLRAYGTIFQDWFLHDFGKVGYPEKTPHVTAYARDFSLTKVPRAGWDDGILLEGGRLRASAGPAGEALLPEQGISILISLSENTIHLDYTIKGKAATPLAESAMVPFPLQLPKAAFALGQMGSVIDPARDIREGANRHLWCVDRWVDASDGRVGMAVMPRDMPLVSIGDPGIYRFSTDHVPTEPTIYSHLFNTQWGTNFPQWLEGDFSFRVTLWPHYDDWRAEVVNLWRMHDPGRQFHYFDTRDMQLEGARGVYDLGIKTDEWSVVQGVRPRHDGLGLIMRLWDAHGTHRFASLRIYETYAPVKRVWRCDLMERPLEELRLIRLPRRESDGTEPYLHVNIPVTAHAVETLLLEFD